MLELRNIGKIYGRNDTKVEALKGVNLSFRKNEFVSVLGHSGCGKTTLLNILGGLDKYTSGELIINGITTKNISQCDWDAYRNNSVGFVFQNYNLIPHLTVLGNVEIALTLSGISPKERRKRALAALKEVGIKEKAFKKPNQLSGGQLQRVAIARAIVNKPSIILADEPTGALDSGTSKQVIEILKSISKKYLVIMVTHNTDIANEYSTRIIKLVDGEVVEDSNPLTAEEKQELNKYFEKVSKKQNVNKSEKSQLKQKLKQAKKEYKKQSRLNFKKTSMSFFTAIALSFKNLLTKKFRTLLVAFAGSIGIIGVTLVLAVSNGFNLYLVDFQKTTLMSLPITIEPVVMNYDFSRPRDNDSDIAPHEIEVVSKGDLSNLPVTTHVNNITEDYLQFLDKMNTTLFEDNSDLYANIVYHRDTVKVLFNHKKENLTMERYVKYDVLINNDEFLNKHLQVIAGRLPSSSDEIVLTARRDNTIRKEFLSALGYDVSLGQRLSAETLLEQNLELKLFDYDDWFIQDENQQFVTNETELDNVFNNSMSLKVVGIVKAHPNDDLGIYRSGNSIAYLSTLDEYYYEQTHTSAVANYLNTHDSIIIDGTSFPESDTPSQRDITTVKSMFAASSVPSGISIFSKDFESKNLIKSYLDSYNDDIIETENHIVYADQAELISNAFGEMIDIVSVVLIAFSSISLVVSSIMIGIITYISVIERTKEIGVLRSLGARKKDIARVFLAESMIIGITAGVIGILISFMLTFPINSIVYKLVDIIPRIAVISPFHMLFMTTLSASLTLIAGVIPAYIASKKDPVIALRTE